MQMHFEGWRLDMHSNNSKTVCPQDEVMELNANWTGHCLVTQLPTLSFATWCYFWCYPSPQKSFLKPCTRQSTSPPADIRTSQGARSSAHRQLGWTPQCRWTRPATGGGRKPRQTWWGFGLEVLVLLAFCHDMMWHRSCRIRIWAQL